MKSLDRLEQLTKLRDQGALSEDEFNAQKKLLLRPKRHPWKILGWTICAILAVFLGLIAAGFIEFTKTEQGEKSANSSIADSIEPLGSAALTAVQPVASGNVENTYDWATSSDVLGMNPAFLEKKLGPPQRKTDASMEFAIAECTVSYGIKNGKVDYLTTSVSSKCHPEINGDRITEQTTFGQLDAGLDLVADCLSYCGNAIEPTIDLFSPAAHVSGFVAFLYQGQGGEGISKATELWTADIINQHGVAATDYQNIDADWFQCTQGAPTSVRDALKSEKISAVTIGYSLASACNYR